MLSIVSAVLAVILFVFVPANDDEPAMLPEKIQVVTVHVAKEEE